MINHDYKNNILTYVCKYKDNKNNYKTTSLR